LPTAESHWKTGFDAGHIYSQRMRVFPKAEPMNSGTAPNRKFVGAKVLGDRVNGLGLPGGPQGTEWSRCSRGRTAHLFGERDERERFSRA